MTASTADLTFNPHENRHGDIARGTCHSAHVESTVYCAQCHAEAAHLASELGWKEVEMVN